MISNNLLTWVVILMLVGTVLNNCRSHKVSEHYPYYLPFEYTPVNEYCAVDEQYVRIPMVARKIQQAKKNNKNKIQENFQMVKYEHQAPIATFIFYSFTGCGFCDKVKPEWDKLAKHILRNKRYKKLVKLVERVNDPEIKAAPQLTLIIHADKNRNRPRRVIDFPYNGFNAKADIMENFIIEQLANKSAMEQEGSHYVDPDLVHLRNDCGHPSKKGRLWDKYPVLTNTY